MFTQRRKKHLSSVVTGIFLGSLIFLLTMPKTWCTFCKINNKRKHSSVHVASFDCPHFRILSRDSKVRTIQSVGQSVSQSVSESVSQSVSESVLKSVSQSVSRSVSQSVGQSVRQSVSPEVSQ